MGKSRSVHDIPEIPDIPGLDDDEDWSGPSGGGGSGGSGGRGGGGGRGRGGGRGGGRGAGSSGRRKGSGAFLFLLGVALGVTGGLVLPDLLRPHLPEALRGQNEVVAGQVLGKDLQPDRLLLTIGAEQGAVLATFRERVPEIDLLVGVGDTVQLAVQRYRPFVENPEILGVRKGAPAGTTGRPAAPEVASGAQGVPADAGDTGAAQDTAGSAGDTAGSTADTVGSTAPADTAGAAAPAA